MEFFEFADVRTTAMEIREKISIARLSLFCEAIEAVDETNELEQVVYFLHWGRFLIRAENVMGGIRFSVPDCPNTLAWTVTTGYPPFPEKIVLHATINRTDHDPTFIFAIQDLLVSFKKGLEKEFSTSPRNIRCVSFLITDLRNTR